MSASLFSCLSVCLLHRFSALIQRERRKEDRHTNNKSFLYYSLLFFLVCRSLFFKQPESCITFGHQVLVWNVWNEKLNLLVNDFTLVNDKTKRHENVFVVQILDNDSVRMSIQRRSQSIWYQSYINIKYLSKLFSYSFENDSNPVDWNRFSSIRKNYV